jgi:hypothetical protein
MMKNIQRWHQWVKNSTAVMVATTVATTASAFQFYLGEIEGSLDTTLTAGASWRAEDRDKDALAQGNQGLGPGTTGASTTTTDDGNWNFAKNKTYSKRVSGTTDLLLRYEDYGGFTRLRYFYDKELMDESRDTDAFGVSRPINDEGREQAGADARFLDAYIWGDFLVGEETPLNIRFGKQVVSWGESTFIFGGVNSVNPIDFAAVRAPGAQVKDVLVPVNLLYGSIGVSEDVTAEAFYQLQWEPVQLDPCGTFFSNSDVAAPGCGPITAGNAPETVLIENGLTVERKGDEEASNEGIYGLALRWYAANLGDTEFGFYYTRTHSFLPYANFTKKQEKVPFSSTYNLVYPEGIDMYGVSFNTSTEGGWSVGGEITYRPNFPVARNGFELTAASLDQNYSAFYEPGKYGEVIQGYEEFPVTQAQITFIKFFDQVLGASRLTFVSEFGGTYIHDFVDHSRFGRDATFGIGPVINEYATTDCQSANSNPDFCEEDGFVTDFSAGYRMQFTLNYSDAFAGINLSPALTWSHDVIGWGPVQFRKGAKSIGLKLDAVYLNQYTASIGYTSYFGGEPYNFLNDRDNYSVSVSTSF